MKYNKKFVSITTAIALPWSGGHLTLGRIQ